MAKGALVLAGALKPPALCRVMLLHMMPVSDVKTCTGNLLIKMIAIAEKLINSVRLQQ